MIVAGNKIYERCQDCEELVQINKFMFGGLHFCLTEEERTAKKMARNEAERIKYNQLNSRPKQTYL